MILVVIASFSILDSKHCRLLNQKYISFRYSTYLLVVTKKMISLKVISKSEFKIRAKNGVKIAYGVHNTRFGKVMLGVMQNSICHLGFVDGSASNALKHLQNDWPGATYNEDAQLTSRLVEQIFDADFKGDFQVLLKGGSFQRQVWENVVKVPVGTVVTYEKLASMAGSPRAVRAAGSAMAKNSVAYLIPCHRVVNKNSNKMHYGWGVDRKKLILDFEKTLMQV